jgi:hypothetical protein
MPKEREQPTFHAGRAILAHLHPSTALHHSSRSDSSTQVSAHLGASTLIAIGALQTLQLPRSLLPSALPRTVTALVTAHVAFDFGDLQLSFLDWEIEHSAPKLLSICCRSCLIPVSGNPKLIGIA